MQEVAAARMRVLHVLASLDDRSGGPLRLVLDLSALSEQHGLTSEVLGFGNVSIRDNPLPVASMHALPAVLVSGFCYSKPLRHWCETHLARFDGVVLHGMWQYPQWAVARECFRQRIPYAYFPHGMADPWSIRGQGTLTRWKKMLYWRLIEKRIYFLAAQILFTTPREMARAATVFDLPQHRLILPVYGVDAKPDTWKEEDVRESTRQADDTKVALFLGRLHPKKNVLLLLQAWAEARPQGPWKLIVAGDGDPKYVASLKQYVSSAGIGDRVVFAGQVGGADKQYLFNRAQWFLLPSQQENFGIAVLEAVKAGCAVAISTEVCLADYFPSGAEILPLKLDAWVEFIRSRMTDAAWQSQRAREDRERLLACFDMGVIAQQWADTLISIFSDSRPAAVVAERRTYGDARSVNS